MTLHTNQSVGRYAVVSLYGTIQVCKVPQQKEAIHNFCQKSILSQDILGDGTMVFGGTTLSVELQISPNDNETDAA